MMDENLKLGIFALLVAGLFLAGCTNPLTPPAGPSAGEVTYKEIPRFASYEELVAKLREAQSSGRSYGEMEVLTAVPMEMDAAEAAKGSAEYSETNVQVEGVDEADVIKTDGKYIYAFSRNNLVITDAYPIETAGIVSTTGLGKGLPREMFVSGDKLLLFYHKYADFYPEEVENLTRSYYPRRDMVSVQLYDISDRSAPKLEKEVDFEGNYRTSRLIGENAYFVVNSWVRCYDYMLEEEGGCDIIPLMVEDGVGRKVAEVTEIGWLPPYPASGFVTLGSINLESGSLEKETVMGNAESVYASQGNIYLVSTNWETPNEMPVVKEAEEAIVGESPEAANPGAMRNTIINKFALADSEIKYIGQGSVQGTVLNQFSMDEYEGNFRIATTSGQAWGGAPSQGGSRNNIYVLDKELAQIGALEGLAPDERIYSARFMGEKAYLVTFRKIDPLFVIDMSNPENPTVLGKLKIPGYSDYLHPIDETHLIGVGKDTEEAKEGDFVWYQGMKMAIFDVGDVSNPIEMHKIVIGDRGTDSYALRDHKAFLYDREKELLVLPIQLAEIQGKEDLDMGKWPAYGEPVFQGAFVYRLTLENGFEERGRITHISAEEELKRGYYYGEEYSVKRALYIGDVLYTYSEKMLKANALSDLAGLRDFDFGYERTGGGYGFVEHMPL